MTPRPDPLKGKTKLTNQGEKGEDLTKVRSERGQITADTAETQSTEELTTSNRPPAKQTTEETDTLLGTTSQDEPGRNRKCEQIYYQQ